MELKTLLHGEENRAVPQLFSVPDLAEHTPGEIEVRFLQEAERLGYTEVIVEKKPERNYSTTVMYILAYLDRYGYPVLILIAGALASWSRQASCCLLDHPLAFASAAQLSECCPTE